MPDAPLNRPGYEFDPYKDEGGEVEDSISQATEKYVGKGGILSTWRERHIALAGVWAGLRAGTFSDIPECPPLWMDEIQYYHTAAMVFNVLKCQWPTVAVVIAALGAKYFGIV